MLVTLVELKDIQLPETMKRAMARQAEAEREKRAKIIAAEGESLAAAALGDASDIMMVHPLAPSDVALRYGLTMLTACERAVGSMRCESPRDRRSGCFLHSDDSEAAAIKNKKGPLERYPERSSTCRAFAISTTR